MPNSPPQLCFRPFGEADATVLEPWLREAGLLVPPGTKSGSWARRITEDPRILVRVACFAGRPAEVVGFFRLDLAPDRVAELTMIVSPEHRRKGLGRALLAAALAEARSLSLRRILAMVVGDNHAGFGFFLDRGFEETGIHLQGFRQLARVVHGADRQPPLEISI